MFCSTGIIARGGKTITITSLCVIHNAMETFKCRLNFCATQLGVVYLFVRSINSNTKLP